MNDYTFEGFNGFAKQQPVLAATSLSFYFHCRHSVNSRVSFQILYAAGPPLMEEVFGWPYLLF